MLFQTLIETLVSTNLSSQAREVIMASLSSRTIGQYDTHLSRFQSFCRKRGFQSLTEPLPVEIGIEFLTVLFKSGLSYSSINTARSAISQFISFSNSTEPFGSHRLVTRFMKGAYRLRPPVPKYDSIWDVGPLINYLKSMCVDDLHNLAVKCSTLLALTSGQRVQTLSSLSLDYMVRSKDRITFHIHKIIKTSKPGKNFSVEVKKYDKDANLCPFRCLENYLSMTKDLRSANQLFIGIIAPHASVTSQTISRWIKIALRAAGIETAYGAHSTRHASTSKASASDVPIDQILSKAGWASHDTFAKFYRKPIIGNSTFAEKVLDA